MNQKGVATGKAWTMMPHVSVLTEDERLYNEIMRFLGPHPNLESVGLVLPTQRLATLVLATLAEKKRALLPPKFFNMESLLNALFEKIFFAPTTPKIVQNDPLFVPHIVGCHDFLESHDHQREPTKHSLMWPIMEPLEQECLVAYLIKKSKFRYLRLGHEHEVMQLFNEIFQWEVDDRGWDNLEKAIQNNTYLSDPSLDSLHLRCKELKQLYQLYLKEIVQLKKFPSSLRQTQRVEWILKLFRKISQRDQPPNDDPMEKLLLWTQKSLGSTLLFAGLSSLSPPMTRLLQSMVHAAERTPFFFGIKATFLTSTPPDLISAHNPLLHLLSVLGWSQKEPRDFAKKKAHPFTVKKHPDPLSECRWCLDQAMELVSTGYEPSSIALLITDETRYGPYLRMLTPEYAPQCPEGFNIALQMPLKESLLGRWFEGLLLWLQFGRGPGDLEHASRFFCHPLLQKKMSELPFENISPPDTWSNIDTDADRSPLQFSSMQHTSQDAFLSHISRYVRLSTSQPQWTDFVRKHESLLSPLLKFVDNSLSPFFDQNTQKPLAQWAKNLKEFVNEFLPLQLDQLPDNFFEFSTLSGLKDATLIKTAFLEENIGIKLSSYSSLADFLENLCQQGDETFLLNTKDFLHIVGRLFDSLKIQSTGDPLYGIQILGIPEARYVPFRKVFILGALEGQFPRALPHDHVLDNSLKRAMGLPGWQLLESIEDTTFYILRMSDAHLTLTYPDEGGTAVRSRFIEMALILGEAALHGDQEVCGTSSGILSSSTLALDHHEANKDLSNPTAPTGYLEFKDKSHVKGLFETLHNHSQGTLKKLLMCPYRYFLEATIQDPVHYEDQLAAVREGKVLHKIMELFFSTQRDHSQVKPLPKDPPQDQSWEFYFAERLHEIATIYVPPELVGSPLLLHMKLKGWNDFARFLSELYFPHQPSQWIYLRHSRPEVSFAFQKDIGLDSGPLSFKGRIDLLLATPFGQIVLDFKRKSVPSKNAALLGDDPQLLLYAMALNHLSSSDDRDSSLSEQVHQKTILGYFSLIDGTWLGVACSADQSNIALEKNLISSKNPEELANILKKFQLRLKSHLERMILKSTEVSRGEIIQAEKPRTFHFWLDEQHCDTCPSSGICRKDEKDPRKVGNLIHHDGRGALI